MREKHLETCLVISTGLTIAWFFFQHIGLLYAAVTIGVIGAFVDSIARWIHWLWYKIAEVMGGVMSKVLLSLVFFLFLVPLALIYRLFSKDELQLRKKAGGSYWTVRKQVFGKGDLEDMW
ncbi:MAG: hypothetical protein AAF960_04705 [Bacteroidota bacterium]